MTADRKPDKLPTTVDGAPMEVVAPGPIVVEGEEAEAEGEEGEGEEAGEEEVEEDMTFESDFR